MGEINSAQYSSVFPRFLLSLGFHPLGEDAKSCESPWLLVETAFFTPLSVDLGYKLCKTELGWADAMVRADVALRRHWLLIFCAFPCCWLHCLQGTQAERDKTEEAASRPSREKKHSWPVALLARSLETRPRMGNTLGGTPPLVAGLE